MEDKYGDYIKNNEEVLIEVIGIEGKFKNWLFVFDEQCNVFREKNAEYPIPVRSYHCLKELGTTGDIRRLFDRY